MMGCSVSTVAWSSQEMTFLRLSMRTVNSVHLISIRWGNESSIRHEAVVARRISCCIVRAFHLINSPAHTIYRLFLASIDITLKQFQKTTRICRQHTRRCFEAAVSLETLSDATDEVLGTIKESKGLADAVVKVYTGQPIHPAFQVYPSESKRWVSCLPYLIMIKESRVPRIGTRW
jgi:hypothetical protein